MRIYSRLLSTIAIATLFGFAAPAQSDDEPAKEPVFDFTTGGLMFNVLDDNTAYVAWCDTTLEQELTIPTTVNIENKDYAVTAVGDYAFDKSKFTKIIVPEGITALGECAFSCSYNLRHAEIPSTITEFGDNCFLFCDSLETVKLAEGLTSLGNSMFIFCGNLKDVELPKSITTLGTYAFWGCSSLKSFKLPDAVNTVPLGLLYCCTGLENIELHEGVTTIEYDAFAACASIKSIEIPESVTYIGGNAFRECLSLESIRIPKNVTDIDQRAFLYDSGLKSVVIEGRLRTITYGCFRGCTAMETLILPESVALIDEWAFSECYSLKSLVIPDKVTTIKQSAFTYPLSLEELVLGENLSTVDFLAFYGCNNLKKITCRSEYPPLLADNTIFMVNSTDAEGNPLDINNTYNNAEVIVPDESLDFYKNDPIWSLFKNIKTKQSGISDIETAEVTVTATDDIINVTGAEGLEVEVYNISGQKVYSGAESSIQIGAAGVYLVKIGTKVVKVHI